MVSRMANTSTARVIRFRQRQKFDQIVLTVTVAREPLSDLLIESGLLHQAADDNRSQIEGALEKFIETVCKERP